MREKLRKGEIKIEFASSDSIKHFEFFVDRILDVIADVTGIDGIRTAMVTDESSIGDFAVRPDQEQCTDEEYEEMVAEVSKILGVPVKRGDYLVDIAKRLKDA